jgi:hypothetical protein
MSTKRVEKQLMAIAAAALAALAGTLPAWAGVIFDAAFNSGSLNADTAFSSKTATTYGTAPTLVTGYGQTGAGQAALFSANANSGMRYQADSSPTANGDGNPNASAPNRNLDPRLGTIELLLKPGWNGSIGRRTILEYSHVTSQDYGTFWLYASGTNLLFRQHDVSGSATGLREVSLPVSFDSNTWIFLAATWDRTNATVYVKSNPTVAGAVSSSLTNTAYFSYGGDWSYLFFGSRYGAGGNGGLDNLGGTLDRIVIRDNVLSASQIQADADSLLPPRGTVVLIR